MFQEQALQPLMCPRCTAPLAPGEQACRRCGQQVARTADGRLVAAGAVCPRCNRPAQPGQAYFTATGSSPAGTCAYCGSPMEAVPPEDPAAYFEEKAESCAPFDLDRVARSEAVDGWAMMDTTVDPARPGRILVHFRRPAREVPPDLIRAAQARQAATRAAAAAAAAAMMPTGPADAPATGPESAVGVGTRPSGASYGIPAGTAVPGTQRPQSVPGLPWSLPLATATAVAEPLLAEWRRGRMNTAGDLLVGLVSLSLAAGVFAAVFAIAMVAVILSRLFRGAGFLALLVVVPALLAIVLGALRVMTGSGHSRRANRQARHAARRAQKRDRHGVAWHRP
jgi:hypothetical protein